MHGKHLEAYSFKFENIAKGDVFRSKMTTEDWLLYEKIIIDWYEHMDANGVAHIIHKESLQPSLSVTTL